LVLELIKAHPALTYKVVSRNGISIEYLVVSRC